MKRVTLNTLLAGLFAIYCIPAMCQVETIEHLPDDDYVSNWRPIFSRKIVSYVQLPGDWLEYRKINVYVVYRAGPNIGKTEELLKSDDLSRRRYLGAHLEKTGRTFTSLLDDSVLGVENTNLTTQDQLMNNEMMFVRKDTNQ